MPVAEYSKPQRGQASLQKLWHRKTSATGTRAIEGISDHVFSHLPSIRVDELVQIEDDPAQPRQRTALGFFLRNRLMILF